MTNLINTIDFKKAGGLIPVVIQNNKDKEVLMVGYMNKAALEKTRKNGYVHFWSRSRNELWLKGKTSGNKLKVVSIFTDCDNDCLLIKVNLEGQNVCHTGEYSCFYTKII